MLPPAPPRFSTTTLWPSALASGSVRMRTTMSFAPPGTNGTTIVTGRSGYSARLGGESATSPRIAKPARRRALMLFSVTDGEARNRGRRKSRTAASGSDELRDLGDEPLPGRIGLEDEMIAAFQRDEARAGNAGRQAAAFRPPPGGRHSRRAL